MKKYLLILSFGLIFCHPRAVLPAEPSGGPAKILFCVGLVVTVFFVYKEINQNKEVLKSVEKTKKNEKEEVKILSEKIENNKPVEYMPEKPFLICQGPRSKEKIEKVHIDDKKNEENALEIDNPNVRVPQENVLMRFLRRFKKYFHV